MKQVLATMPAFDAETGDLNVIIETPKGSRTKYAYDQKTGLFEMRKLLPAGMAFPFDFGFIPQTKAEDGDPLDVLIVSDGALFTGCLVKARLIGGFRAQQTPKGMKKAHRNDRLFAVPVLPTIPHPPGSMNELDEKLLADLESFFVSYNAVEGRVFKVLRTMTRKEAETLVRESSGNGASRRPGKKSG